MVQEFNVVRCFSCQTFQVEQVKKSTNKWSCKLCNEKQSLKRVYFQGTGKECRLNCQALNIKRGEELELHCEDEDEETYVCMNDKKMCNPTFQPAENPSGQPSRWEQFLEKETSEFHDDNDCDDNDDGSISLFVKFRGEQTTNNIRKRKQSTIRNASVKSSGTSKVHYGDENTFEGDKFTSNHDYQSKISRNNFHAVEETEGIYCNVGQSTNKVLCDNTRTNTVENHIITNDYDAGTRDGSENEVKNLPSVHSKWAKFLSVEEEELDDEL